MPDQSTTDTAGDAAFQQWLATQGGNSVPTQIIQDQDGNWVIVDKATGKVTPLGIKGKPPTDQTKNRVLASGSSASDQYIVTFDADGNVQTAPNPNYVAPTVKPKDTVPGSGTAPTPGTLDQNGDPIGATPGTPDLPVDAFNAQNTAKNDAAARAISQQNADTSAANSAEAIKQHGIDNARQAASDAWQRAQAVIEQGYKDRQYSLEEAKQRADDAHAQISEWLTQRGQNLDYLGKQSFVTAGQYGALQSDESNLAKTGGVAFTPSPTPPGLGYDPAQLAASLAKQALGSTQQPQQPFSMGQAPAQPAGPGFIPPNLESGGAQTNNPAMPIPAGARQ